MKNTKTFHFARLLSIILLMLLFNINTNAQGWRSGYWASIGGIENNHNNISGLTPFVNGTVYGIANYSNDSTSYINAHGTNESIRVSTSTSPFEDLESNYISKGIARYGLDTMFVLFEKILPNNMNQFVLLKRAVSILAEDYYPIASTIWERNLAAPAIEGKTAISIKLTVDGNLIILASKNEAIGNLNQDLVLIKITPEAEVLWVMNYEVEGNETPVEIVQTSDGGYIILKNIHPAIDPSIIEPSIVKVDENGVFEWEHNIGETNTEEGYDLATTSDGNIVVTGTNRTNVDSENPFFLKIDESGNILWRRDYNMPGRQVSSHAIREDQNGNLIMTGSVLDDEGALDFFLIKANADGTPVWEKNIGLKNKQDAAFYLSIAPDGGYLSAGYRISPNSLIRSLYFVKTDSNGVVKPGYIWGNVFNDLDVDCLETNGDLDLNDWIVRAYQDSTSIFYATTDEFGNYGIPVDTGNYVVSVLSGAYWLPCHNDSIIHLGYLDTINIDFPLQVEIECPLLTVDIGITSVLRPCEAGNYVFNYCNRGTAMAEDAYVEVTIDPLLLFNSASITPSEIEGNVYTFILEDIASGECESFTINVTPNCDSTELGMILCMDAHIYPDSLCSPEFVNWGGAFLQVSATCDEENEELIFQVENIGDAATSVPRHYVIIEDAILLMQGNIPEIGSGEIEDIPTDTPLPANGSTYHLYIEQEPGTPYAEEISVGIEGCGTNESGGFSTGFYNQFPFEDAFFTASFCVPLLGSYDPNDKRALPTGYGEENTIWQNIDLNYAIRFQNVGTDTAFRVVIIDTLSQFLDPETIIPGAASHDYDFKIENAEDGSQAILIFTFNDIQLVDSLTNEQGSQGFVNFKIAQKRDNPIGSLIENEAGIYFDFNLPIITNQVWHTVGEPLLDIVDGTQQTFVNDVIIKAYPNPFSSKVRVEIEGFEYENIRLNLYDASGRIIKQLSFKNGKVDISAEGLMAGFYFYKIESTEKLIGSGKLIVK